MPESPAPTVERLAYSLAEAELALNIGHTKMCELVTAGVIRTVRAGRRRLIPASALKAFVDGQPTGADEHVDRLVAQAVEQGHGHRVADAAVLRRVADLIVAGGDAA